MNRTAPVCKLGHVQLSTPDIDASLHFFRDLVGLDVIGEDDGKVYLRAWNEIDHHSLVLREGPTGVDHFALRASSAAHLEALAADLRAHGHELEEVAAGAELGQGDAIRFVSPQGHPWEVYWEMEKGRQDSLLLNQRGKAYLRGSSPMHLDHINIACVDVAAGEAFLADRLGFLRREYVQPTDGPVVASWMSVSSPAATTSSTPTGSPSAGTRRTSRPAWSGSVPTSCPAPAARWTRPRRAPRKRRWSRDDEHDRKPGDPPCGRRRAAAGRDQRRAD